MQASVGRRKKGRRIYEGHGDWKSGRKRERERERVCVCVCERERTHAIAMDEMRCEVIPTKLSPPALDFDWFNWLDCQALPSSGQ